MKTQNMSGHAKPLIQLALQELSIWMISVQTDQAITAATIEHLYYWRGGSTPTATYSNSIDALVVQ